MAENIVASLFGLTPTQILQQRAENDYKSALGFAQLSPVERLNISEFQAGQQVGRGLLGSLGIQDEQEMLARQQQEIQRQIDHSTPEGLLQGAQLFNQAGNPRMAYMYQQAAVAKQQELANIQRTKAQEELYRAQAEKALTPPKEEPGQKYSSQIGKLVYERSLHPVGSEEYKAYTRMIDAEIAAKRAPAERAGQNSIPKPPQGYRYTANGELEPIPGGPKDTSAKEKAARERARSKAEIVIGKIDEAIKKTNPLSAGFIGDITRVIGGSPAADLETTVDTIVANIGFDELAAMRQASPTGGALGQVAVRELDMLQATLGSLKQKQSPSQLRANLKKLMDHYQNWLNTVKQSAQEENAVTPTPRAAPNDLAAAARAELERRRGGK